MKDLFFTDFRSRTTGSKVRRKIFSLFILFIAGCFFLAFGYAQEAPAPQTNAQTAAPMSETERQVDDLKNSLNNFVSMKPSIVSLSSFDARQRKALEKALEDSKTLMKIAPSEELRLWTAELRLRALLAHAWIKVPDTFSQLREMNELASLLKNAGKAEALVKNAEYRILMFSIKLINTEKDDAPNPFKVKATVARYVKGNAKQLEQFGPMFIQAAKDYGTRNKDFTLEALREFSDIYQESKFHEDIVQAENLRKAMKRFETIGSPVTIRANDMYGQPVSLLNYRNKVVLIDFYAAWCMPCVVDLPRLQELYKKYRSKGFEIIGISADKSEADAAKFIREKNITWKVIYDTTSTPQLSQEFGITSYPTMMLVGRNGKLHATDLSLEALEKEIEKLTFGFSEKDSANPFMPSDPLKINLDSMLKP